MEFFILKPLVVGKLSLFSGMQNDASMHRETLERPSALKIVFFMSTQRK